METSASQVKFDDGKTFQDKLNSGELKGDKGNKGDKGDKGETGASGKDGLTTSVTVGGVKYTHTNGNIALPNYPTLSSLGAEPANSNIQAHISSTHAPSNAQKNSDITKTEIEAKLTGTISTHTHANSTTTTNGLMSSSDKVKLDGIASGANNYIHPSSHPATIITQTSSHRFVTDAEKSTWNEKETTSGAQTKANTAKTEAIASAKAYTDEKVSGLVNSAPETLDTLKELSSALGDDPNFATTVATQIGTKADISYVNTELSKKANSSHGTHVSYHTSAPLVAGTASSGSSSTVSRGDHVHPAQTSVSGNAGTATKLATPRTINGTSFDGSANITTANWGTARNITIGSATKSVNGSKNVTWTLDEIGASASSHGAHVAYGTCTTGGSTAEKVVSINDSNWVLTTGSVVMVKFTTSNTASSVKLNVNGTGGYPIWYNNAEYTGSGSAYTGYANRVTTYMFNGTHWVWIASSYDANSTYSNASLGQGYVTCSTAEETIAKVGTLSSYALTVGGIVSVKFSYNVPANSTLNINSKGAKAIYYRGVAITSNVIKGGDIATFIYNGSQYHLISIDNLSSSFDSATNSDIDAMFGSRIYKMVQTTSPVSSEVDGYFCSEAPYSQFQSVKVDNSVVVNSNYEVSDRFGSTQVKLNKEYIGTLATGEHNIEIVSSKGSATSSFNIEPTAPPITFYIYTEYKTPTTYTAKQGMTWGDWIKSYGMNTDNGIIMINPSNSLIYLSNSHRFEDGNMLKKSRKGTLADGEEHVDSVIEEDMHYVTHNTEIPYCCFDAGSQVLMADGTTKDIEKVVVGDMVISLDENSKQFITQKVKDTIIKHNSDDLVYLNLSNGEQIGMRAYHPLLTTDGWKSLRPELVETISDVGHVPLLEVGDILVGYSENPYIVSIETRPDIENYDTYNLTVEGHHNYIVNGIVAHNAGCK